MARERWSVARGAVMLLLLLALAAALAPAGWIAGLLPVRSPEPFDSSTGLLLFGRAGLMLVGAAAASAAGVLALQRERKEQEVPGGRATHDRGVSGRVALAFLLSVLLLLRAVHSLYWLFIWDSTHDALDQFWLPIPIFALFFGGMFFLASLPGRLKVLGIAFPLLGLVLVGMVYDEAKGVDFRQLTEERAAEMAEALERYYERHGYYPDTLQALTPGTILSVPGPVIIFGQSWCYEGGGDAYRLGYVYREHWSDPRLQGRLFRAKGNVGDGLLCTEEIQALQARDPAYPYVQWQGEGQ